MLRSMFSCVMQLIIWNASQNRATVMCEEIYQQEIVLMADAVLHLPLLQVIDTSAPCTHSLTPQPLCWHSTIDVSLPVQ